MSAEIKPIQSEDLPAVCEFLHRIDPNRSPENWQKVLTPDWPGAAGTYGHMIVVDGAVGGAIGQLRSRRSYGGRLRDSCNLTSWYVDLAEGAGRGLGVQLLREAVSDSGAVYATHSPEPRTIKVFLRIGFQHIDTTEWIVPNLPRWRTGGFTETHDIAAHLDGEALANFTAHSAMPTVGHVGLIGPEKTCCHVAFVRSRWRKVPTARIVYSNDYDLLGRCLPAFSRIALTRFGFPLTAIEKRRYGGRPPLAIAERPKEPILFRGDGVRADEIDSLFTEVVTFAPRLR
jgi:hypothetical protein